MKSDDVRRSVRTAHSERDAGDAPNMGKVSRIPGTGLPKEKRKKRISKSTGRKHRARRNRKRVIAAWTFLIGCATVACLSVTIWLGLKYKTNSVNSGSKLPASAEKDAPAIPRVPSLSEKEQISLVKEGLAVRDPARLPDYFRQGERSPAEMVAFLASRDADDGELDRCEWIGSSISNSLPIDQILVHFKHEGKPRNRIAELVPDSLGKWKIDFDAFARISDPLWDEPAAGDSKPAKVRVFITRDNYFNGPFKDDREWLCFGIASPDSVKNLTGYCKIGSPQALALNRVLAQGGLLIRAVIEIRHQHDAEARQFIISKVIAEGWVVGDMIFEERFK